MASLQKENTPVVSIHAPARGATGNAPVSGCFSKGFNPRAREGRDMRILETSQEVYSFNPRAREGRDSFL